MGYFGFDNVEIVWLSRNTTPPPTPCVCNCGLCPWEIIAIVFGVIVGLIVFGIILSYMIKTYR